jgi:phosphoribosylaminoimidazole carboxylase PurE protein
MKKIGIIMGSDSDLPIIKKATDMLKALEIPFEVHIYSAHRTPVEARDFAVNARANGFGALICAAGMAAHLAGAIAANTTLPVIGINYRVVKRQRYGCAALYKLSPSAHIVYGDLNIGIVFQNTRGHARAGLG